MLWVDKHRPHALDKFAHANVSTAEHLKRLVADGDCPHLLFYGVSGAGKKTLALAVLREIFGPGVEKVKVEGKTWKIEQGERKIEVELTTMSSNYHVEMNPSDAGNKDRYVVQEVIKEMAKSRPIDAAGNQGFKGAFYLTLVPIRPRRRGERRSLRTFPVVSLRPHLAFNPRPRRISTPTDAFQLHPDVAMYGTSRSSRRIRSRSG